MRWLRAAACPPALSLDCRVHAILDILVHADNCMLLPCHDGGRCWPTRMPTPRCSIRLIDLRQGGKRANRQYCCLSQPPKTVHTPTVGPYSPPALNVDEGAPLPVSRFASVVIYSGLQEGLCRHLKRPMAPIPMGLTPVLSWIHDTRLAA